MTLSAERLAEIEARLAAATPGPWKAERGTVAHEGHIVITAEHVGMTSNTPLAHLSTILGEDEVMPDASLIAHAPTDISDLHREVTRLRALADGMAGALDDLIDAVMSSDNGFEDYVLQSLFRARRTMTQENQEYRHRMPALSTYDSDKAGK